MKNPALPSFAGVLGGGELPIVYVVTITAPLVGAFAAGTRTVTVTVTPEAPSNTVLTVLDGATQVGTGTVGAGAVTSSLAVGAHALTARVTVDGRTFTSAAVEITCTAAVITMTSSVGEFAPRVHLYPGETANVLWTLADGTTSTSLTPVSTTGGTHTLTVDPPTAIECLSYGYNGGDGGNDLTPLATYAWPTTTLATVSGLQEGAPNLRRFLANNTTSLTGAVDLSELTSLQVAEFFLSEISAADYSGCIALRRTCHEGTNISAYDVSDSLVFEDMRGRGQGIGTTPLVIAMPSDCSRTWHMCVGDQAVKIQGLDALANGTVAVPAMQQWWTWGGRFDGVLALRGGAPITGLLANDNLHTGFDTTNTVFSSAAACDMSRNPLTSLVLAGASTLSGGIHFWFAGCGMSQALVDYAIETLAGGTGVGGTLDLTGNAAPSAARADDILTLQGRGWTVIVAT